MKEVAINHTFDEDGEATISRKREDERSFFKREDERSFHTKREDERISFQTELKG